MTKLPLRHRCSSHQASPSHPPNCPSRIAGLAPALSPEGIAPLFPRGIASLSPSLPIRDCSPHPSTLLLRESLPYPPKLLLCACSLCSLMFVSGNCPLIPQNCPSEIAPQGMSPYPQNSLFLRDGPSSPSGMIPLLSLRDRLSSPKLPLRDGPGRAVGSPATAGGDVPSSGVQ